jgi:two-component system nitrogen regulation sensor histidine kinase NtrY
VSLKNKLLSISILLHIIFFIFAFVFREDVGYWFFLIEFILILSLSLFIWLIRKALQPLEYIGIFSTLLKEEEFTSRFSYLKQPDLDKLIYQFNLLLEKLHRERLVAGERHHVFEKLMDESPIGVLLLDTSHQISEYNSSAIRLLNNDQLNLSDRNIKNSPLYLQSINQSYSLNKIALNQHQLISRGDGKRLKIGHYQFRDRGFYRSFYLIEEFTHNLIKSQKESYENLIKTMSHEVNNTIAITNSLLESSLSYKDQLSQESGIDFEKALKVVINRCFSLNQFMQGYSEIVKLQKPVKMLFNLTQLVKNLSNLFYSEMNKNDIHLKMDLEKDQEINADPHLIEQALINILKNAIEAIEEQKQTEGKTNNIEIILKSSSKSNAESKSIQLDIIDSGCGISSEVKHQLFTPFFTTKTTGQGIGLMLIDEILTSHNFQYQLNNNQLNNNQQKNSLNQTGASFRINFIKS